jgi:hypothetical protein
MTLTRLRIKSSQNAPHYYSWILVVVLTTAASLFLIFQTQDIKCWPSDSCLSYVPTAAKLSWFTFPSQMHQLPQDRLSQLNMHGKEILIIGIAFFQWLLQDKSSLFPNILLLILSFQISALLLFLIFQHYFDEITGFVVFIIYLTSFWPYLYIVLGAHQPLVLANFLISLILLQQGRGRPLWNFMAGSACGIMLFSSPTAFLFIPYFFVPAILLPKTLQPCYDSKSSWRVQALWSWGLGCLLVILALILPHPGRYFQTYQEYVLTNQAANHFRHYQDVLKATLPISFAYRGFGWLWIFRYMQLIMPVLFPCYLLSVIYLLIKSRLRPNLLFLILIAFSSPLVVETFQAAQFGRNYFSWFWGILIIIGYALHDLKIRLAKLASYQKQLFYAIFFILLGCHISWNCWILFGEILPTRLATAHLRRWLDKNDIHQVYVYQNHPRNPFVVDVLNDPGSFRPIKFVGITSLAQPQQGVVLVPPKKGRTIWNNCMDRSFERDPILNWLFESSNIQRCTIASLPSIASSRMWAQEEEICSYFDLVGGEPRNYQQPQSRIYLLDIEKVKNLLPEIPRASQ